MACWDHKLDVCTVLVSLLCYTLNLKAMNGVIFQFISDLESMQFPDLFR